MVIDRLRVRNPQTFETFGSPAAMLWPITQIGFAVYLFQGVFKRDFAGDGMQRLCWILLLSHMTAAVLFVVMVVRWM